MNRPIVTVFGGTGFLGRHIVGRLRYHGFSVRIASRHPARAGSGPDDPDQQSVAADIHDPRSVAAALAGAYGAVNAVSLYVERGGATFESVHVAAAERIATEARQAGVERFVHVSGIGADAASPSLYIRKRGEGELVVRAAFRDAVIVRPAIMFGPDDAFLNLILGLLRRLPVYPMFGTGMTRLQPAYVDDVGEALARALSQSGGSMPVFECGGPRIYRYRELLETIARGAGLQPRLVPLPFSLWRAIAWVSEKLPNPPLTRNQVELMQVDSVTAASMPGFAELGLSPRSVEDLLQQMVDPTGTPPSRRASPSTDARDSLADIGLPSAALRSCRSPRSFDASADDRRRPGPRGRPSRPGAGG
jgi:NADH dehydrogenase